MWHSFAFFCIFRILLRHLAFFWHFFAFFCIFTLQPDAIHSMKSKRGSWLVSHEIGCALGGGKGVGVQPEVWLHQREEILLICILVVIGCGSRHLVSVCNALPAFASLQHQGTYQLEVKSWAITWSGASIGPLSTSSCTSCTDACCEVLSLTTCRGLEALSIRFLL